MDDPEEGMISSHPFTHEAEVEEIVKRFRERTLPKSQWTHHAHLVVGLWHVLEHGSDEALVLLRERISRYNEATGVRNTDAEGYHDTWTAFFVHALDAYARARSAEQERLALFNGLAISRLKDKFLALVFYSRDRMMSVEARRGFIEPDVLPFSQLETLLSPRSMAETPYYLRRAARSDADALIRLIMALADFERLDPPDAGAQGRLIEDAFGAKPRFEPWLAFADGEAEPVAYAIFLETYSSFLARPTLYIEDIFVLSEFRKQGIGGALLSKAVELAHQRGCGRLEWTALDWNVNAQRVYEDKLGAKRMSEWFLYRMTQREIDDYLKKNA